MSDATAAGATPDNPFAVLLAVQDLDTSITQHEHRKAALPERQTLNELHARAATIRRHNAELDAKRDELATALAHLEEQTAAVIARRKTLEDTMYGARGAAGRDLRAIESEVAQLAGRLSQLEDDELVLLEEQEPLDTERSAKDAELALLSEQARALSAEVVKTDATIDAELSELVGRRNDEATRLPEALFRRYEDLRAHLGGMGAARLIGDRCDGCHLSLPSAEVDRIRRLPPDAIATCDQCGRILVRASLLGGA
ncbi:MAG: zinc ribbon domain-containing protein [Acidimicrobiales bacterium]